MSDEKSVTLDVNVPQPGIYFSPVQLHLTSRDIEMERIIVRISLPIDKFNKIPLATVFLGNSSEITHRYYANDLIPLDKLRMKSEFNSHWLLDTFSHIYATLSESILCKKPDILE